MPTIRLRTDAEHGAGAQTMSSTEQEGPVAKAVNQLIAETQLSVEAFAAKAGLSRNQIDRIRRGKTASPRDDTLRKIATAAGRDSESLIAVRDAGAPLPAAPVEDDQQLRDRVESLEETVAHMAELLEEMREVFRPPPGNGQDPAAR